MLNSRANRGRALEELIERITDNVPGCVLFRQANRWVPLRGGRGGAFPARGAPVDFVGAVRGVPVVLECKEVGKGKRFPLTASRLPEQEIRAMERFEEAGGRAFLLVAFWGEDALAVYPFYFVREMLASGMKSLRVEEGVLFSLGARKDVPLVSAAGLMEMFACDCSGDRYARAK
jgi:hypothetical protein